MREKKGKSIEIYLAFLFYLLIIKRTKMKFNHNKPTLPEAMGITRERAKEIFEVSVDKMIESNNTPTSSVSTIVENIFNALGGVTTAEAFLVGRTIENIQAEERGQEEDMEETFNTKVQDLIIKSDLKLSIDDALSIVLRDLFKEESIKKFLLEEEGDHF